LSFIVCVGVPEGDAVVDKKCDHQRGDDTKVVCAYLSGVSER
jgi:hypothetical protein